MPTVAVAGEGLEDVVAALERHFRYLSASGTLERRRLSRLRERVVEVVEHRVRQRLWSDAATGDWLEGRLPALAAGRTTPFAVADELLARSGNLLTGTTP